MFVKRRLKDLLGQKVPYRGIQVNKLIRMIDDKMYELEKEDIVKEINEFDDAYEFTLADGNVVLVTIDVE